MENVINNLVGYKNLKIVQCNDYFNFSLDSVLLPNFVTLQKKNQRIIDLGTGNAPIPLILSTKTDSNIVGVEVQKEIFDLACKSIKINHLNDKIDIKNLDIRNLKEYYKSESFDIVLSNPPYFKKKEDSILNINEVKTNARHETLITLEEIISTAGFLLKNKGILALIHRTERFSEIVNTMKKYRIEPKKVRFIYPKKGSESNLVLIEGRKNSNIGLKVLFPLIVHKANGEYTKEVLKMFE